MSRRDRGQLLAELTFLRAQLDELPAHAMLTRRSTESRILAVEEELAQLPPDDAAPARVELTFNGGPVVGSRGIFAEFGMKAVNAFTDAVAAVAASALAPLAAMGPIPNRDQHQMLITSTARGSFGFVLEEHSPPQLALEQRSGVAQALDRTQALLEGTQGSDEQLADSASETDPRALEKIRVFLQTLVEHDAVCALRYADRQVRFTDVGQVRRSLARLSRDNLREEERILEGEFLGALPKGRVFEFILADSGEVIRGKLGSAIRNADELIEHRHELTRIRVMVTLVGKGRPRYLLLDSPVWSPRS